MTWKPNVRAWQAECAHRRNHACPRNIDTTCTQTLHVTSELPDDDVQRRLKYWLNSGASYSSRTDHMTCKAKKLAADDVPTGKMLLADKLPSYCESVDEAAR